MLNIRFIWVLNSFIIVSSKLVLAELESLALLIRVMIMIKSTLQIYICTICRMLPGLVPQWYLFHIKFNNEQRLIGVNKWKTWKYGYEPSIVHELRVVSIVDVWLFSRPHILLAIVCGTWTTEHSMARFRQFCNGFHFTQSKNIHKLHQHRPQTATTHVSTKEMCNSKFMELSGTLLSSVLLLHYFNRTNTRQ